MAHVRQSIRDNIETTLTGLTTTGSNVFVTRLFPMEETKLPALTIYTKTEATEYASLTQSRTQLRSLQVIVEAYVKGTANIDNTIDTIAVEVEEALATDVTRGGYAKDTRVADIEIGFNGDAEQSVAVARFTVDVDYVTIEGDAEAAV